jgi:hypothetical protein
MDLRKLDIKDDKVTLDNAAVEAVPVGRPCIVKSGSSINDIIRYSAPSNADAYVIGHTEIVSLPDKQQMLFFAVQYYKVVKTEQVPTEVKL